ncbi:MAG: FtsQ-type POTRA domain-containing protein [Blastocatellia bacterium]|nr:FtsQ-type POTRA domain-containing protein [Blastocatellia bacterium]
MMASEKVKQVVVPRKKSGSDPKLGATTKKMKKPTDWALVRSRLWLGSKVMAALLLMLLGLFLYDQISSSSVFQLHAIELTGGRRVNSEEVEKLVRKNLSGSLITTSLGDLQKELQTIAWIKKAEVTRILPDKLKIRIEERKPLLLARFESHTAVWVDEDGVVLGDYESSLDKDIPPLVYGFSRSSSEAAKAENKERVDIYKKLMVALDSGPIKYSNQVEEIDLSNLKDVRLQLIGSSKLSRKPVEVALGNRDFRARIVLAFDVLDALRRHDQATLRNYHILDEEILKNPELISFISVVHPSQVAIKLAKPIFDLKTVDGVRSTERKDGSSVENATSTKVKSDRQKTEKAKSEKIVKAKGESRRVED